MSEKRVVVAAPRGYCAGVDRAVVTVEKALDVYGPPVYVRKQIVHNRHVVEDLEARGAVFVEELAEVPSGATVVFSAHGVSPAVHAEAAERGLKTIDATCPLVTKVHNEARRFPRPHHARAAPR
jgi:4-hydroxy-3-methylbut-2-enyl diphosphate reductase